MGLFDFIITQVISSYCYASLVYNVIFCNNQFYAFQLDNIQDQKSSSQTQSLDNDLCQLAGKITFFPQEGFCVRVCVCLSMSVSQFS